MELPDDVLALIRDYSRPVFKHYQVYNTAIKVLGVYGGWDALKEKLETDADSVIPTLLAYQIAFQERKDIEKELRVVDMYLNESADNLFIWDDKERMAQAVRKAKKIESNRFRFLHAILYPYP